MMLGLRTVIYRVGDLKEAKEWYRELFAVDPYFDEPFYVGFNIGGYELGLDPDATSAPPGAGGVVAYWGVTNADEAVARAKALGVTLHTPAHEVGSGIRVATLQDPFGNLLGLIENPHFKLPS